MTDTGKKVSVIKAKLSKPAQHIISAQVLNEFSNIAYKKLGFPSQKIVSEITAFQTVFMIVPLTTSCTLRAVAVKDRYGFSYYDSLIVATALENQCSFLYSEDMQHGQVVDTLTIINPFI
ncbi:MAG: Programmed cell death toxin MazF like [uncultured Cytophagales bacterium]|uniref:Programmed cell death toxin MazF like n=1 Tax=uncultured Cytophagales bacterium TaxID=158755 RepID=A0A6J4JPT7_9SPHI|nr:MAG: Programmed cell death toxin MazF like [uncultured Cytophagales bacterium]